VCCRTQNNIAAHAEHEIVQTNNHIM